MPKVKLMVARVGTGFTQNRGDVIEVSGAEAERMVAAGQAELIREAKRETATRKPKAEKA